MVLMEVQTNQWWLVKHAGGGAKENDNTDTHMIPA